MTKQTKNFLKPREWVTLADWLAENLPWYASHGGTTYQDVATDAAKELKFAISPSNVRGVCEQENLTFPLEPRKAVTVAGRVTALEDRITALEGLVARLAAPKTKTSK